jgi:FlaA1/EpsC-like NDP-sugar epimerase
MKLVDLTNLVRGRIHDLFLSDFLARRKELQHTIGGSRVLVIGGAGSIGAATISNLITFSPKALHVIDQNENSLAELVRDLRSSTEGLPVLDFLALPLDFGSTLMRRFLAEMSPYDIVMNFAALKHVRSEKDIYSLLQMLDTNVIKQACFLRWLSETQSAVRYFCVSTDKAANPVNLMGASKRLMEHVIFSDEIIRNSKIQVTSARFANVAFSAGSLLDGFLNRLEKHQPLAVPQHAQRYFISLREAGLICLLAAICVPHGHILIPRLSKRNDLRNLESVAKAILRYHDYEPEIYYDETEARTRVRMDIEKGLYPLLLTQLDTDGEKLHEEFVGAGESTVEVGMTSLLGVRYSPARHGSCLAILNRLEQIVTSKDIVVTKREIVDWLSETIPQFLHLETGKSLDERM